MAVHLGIQFNPEVLIDDWGLVGLHPSTFFPSVDPLGNAVLHILRIGRHRHIAFFVQRPKALNGCRQLHAIIRCLRLASVQLFRVLAETQHARPAAFSRVPKTGPVGDQLYLLHAAASSPRKKASTSVRISAAVCV
jgi:hypothetical protein